MIKRTRLRSILSICLLTVLPLFGFADNFNLKSDNIPPKIFIKAPNTYFEVLRGDKIPVNLHLQDDQELASYRIVITKGGISSDKYSDAFSTYEQLDADGKTFPSVIGTKTYELNLEVKVKEMAIVGDYSLKFYLKDKAGNEKMIERFFNVCRH